jgi:parallel beta-helix repeat protein
MKFSFGRPFSRLPRSPRASRPGRQTVPCCRPQLEDLESRETPDCTGVYWPAPYNTLLTLPFTSVCNLNDSGGGSLRQAIIDVNGQPPGLYTIFISVPAPQVQQPHVIHLLSALPAIHNRVIIDAVSFQLDWDTITRRPVVQLDGAAAGQNANGLVLNGTGNFVAGLIFSNFGGSAIILQGGPGNHVADCYIGTDPTGTLSRPNNIGITVRNGADHALIGPGILPTAGLLVPGNVISGNVQAGVLLTTDSVFHAAVFSNKIGTDYTGRTALPNRNNGIVINQGSSDNRILYNQISGNTAAGVSVQDRASHHNIIAGNMIGTNVLGTLPLPNHTGVEIIQALDTIVGRPGKVKNGVIKKNTRRNLISGNTIGINVVNVQPNLAGGEKGAIIRNNLIGTDITGMAPMPNLSGGITVQNSIGTTIGAIDPFFHNVIAANGNQGVLIAGGSSRSLIEGNFIGTDRTGTHPLSNTIGVYVQGGSNNTIGGTLPSSGNVLSGNSAAGVTVVFNQSTGNVIEGNFIGTDPTQTMAVPNAIGINVAQAATNTTIGGSAPGAGNIVYFNSTYGVSISDQSTASLVQGNTIFGNGIHGISISRASNNTVGGLAPGAGNTITGNGSDGVLVDTGTGNLIEGNSIYGHPRLGIELLNHGNLSQLAPTITSASTDTTLNVTFVSGTVFGVPNADYTVDFYYNDNLDPTGFGEGQFYLGTITVTTDAGGNASFSTVIDGTMAPNGAAPPGTFVSATATDPNNNTSQFSVGALVGGAGPLTGDGTGGPGSATATVADPTSETRALAQALGDTAGSQPAVVIWPGASAVLPGSATPGRMADNPGPLQGIPSVANPLTSQAAQHQAVDAVFASPAESPLDGSAGDALNPAGWL